MATSEIIEGRNEKEAIEEPNQKGILTGKHGQRLVQIRVEALQLFRRQMTMIIGEKVTRQILYRVGISLGKTAYRTWTDKIADEEAGWKTLNEILQRRGWGYIRSHEKTSSDLSYSVHVGNSALADGPIKDAPPVCDIVRGLLGGWLSDYYNRPVLSVQENKCMAGGEAYCVFQVSLVSSVATAFASGFGN